MAVRQRIICCFARHQEGGACRQLYSSVESLLELGYQVHCLSGSELQLKPHQNLTLQKMSLPCRRERGFWFWFWFSVLAPGYLLTLVFSKSDSTFLAVKTFYAAIARPASFFFRCPIILLLDTLPWPPNSEIIGFGLRRRLNLVVDYLGLLSATRIVTATDALQKDLSEKVPLLRGRMQTIRPALIFPESDAKSDESAYQQWLLDFPRRRRELADELDISERWLILATGGELTSRKNIECLVRAVSATENERIALIVVGDGPERVPLNSIGVGLGLVDQMMFTSWSKNTYEIVGACDVFVMPSMYFGMSNLVIQALSAGAGVLASDVPDMRELLQDDELLFPPNDVEALCQRLQQTLASKGRVEQLRKLSRERAQTLSKNWGRDLAAVISSAKGF